MAKKIVVGMSGGVDSSVSALLLKEQGYEVEGLFMKNWDYGIDGSECPSQIEFEDAKRVGDIIGIDVHGMSFIDEYKDRVFDIFLEKLKLGETPNPDILCNREIKFDVFLKEAQNILHADKIATGHYAKIDKINDKYILGKPLDSNKDQTYFLYTLNQYQLSKAIFPLSNLTKEEVRKIAKKSSLPVFNKKDSTGICFIGKQKFDDFITKYISCDSGDMIDERGNILGKHKGLICYTLGQRKGIGLGSNSNSQNPWYVADKNVKENTITVVQDTNHPLLMSKSLIADQTHWTLEIAPKIGQKLQAQIRYRQKKVSCIVKDIYKDTIEVEFENPQRAVTIGQSLVLYENDKCIGGGFIKSKQS